MLDFHQQEQEILKFWQEKKIFDKLRKQIKGKKRWSFLDGPITANNPMGVHHAWGRTYKDLFQRFKAMQGFNQRFQNGFDCQGLWVEREEERSLGLKNKKDIEKFGILNFVKACRKRVEKFSKVQTEQSIKLGMWMDWDNSYYTMSDTNQLHNWLLLKEYHKKGWLYKGADAVPWCPRCGTASSKHDIATEGYREVTHPALFMRFPVKNKIREYFLIFTTTPWTVPANVALAVSSHLDYVKAKQESGIYWLAESRLGELNGKYEILEKKTGKELEGMKYGMPYKDFESQENSPHEVVIWELASGEEGTGIVHIAPGCGAEDFDLGKRKGFPAISPLDDAGVYSDGFGRFSNKKYSEVNRLVLEDMKKRNFIYKIEPYKHRYPHCWRCGEELVFRLVDEWYIKYKEIKNKLIAENKKVKWYPEYGKIRQEDWFNNMGDWLISRKRYWGLPLPIWECDCGEIEVIGSLKELKEKAIDKKKVDSLPEIHRPWIDEIKIKCKKCGKEVSRVLDVGDAWLDAGIVPLSTMGYLENRKEWEKWFPADLISENMPGQFRGWFNALFWASTTLVGRAPFKAVFGYEMLKDEKGEEMHKSKGNAIWFDDAVEKIGADPMRLLYCLQDPSQELKFGFHVLKEPQNYINILYNMSKLVEQGTKRKAEDIEDKWILSRLNSTIKKATEELENLHPHFASRALLEFWLNDLSRGYIQIVRDRISENDSDVKAVLNESYLTLLKLCAPFMPFITEKVWQDLRKSKIVKEESVHLCSWPKVNNKKINKKIERDFTSLFKVIEMGLASRSDSGIGLKWPLAKAIISTEKPINKELQEVIKRQLNVKELGFKRAEKLEVKLDTRITKELEAEGFAREIARKIQDLRKKAGLVKTDKIELAVVTDLELKKYERFIKERTNASKLTILKDSDGKTEEKFDNVKKESIKNRAIKILFSKRG